MRSLRAFVVALTALSTISLIPAFALTAGAQEEDSADREAAQAGDRAAIASGLVDAAIANRVEVETELAITMARVNDLASELSVVAAGLDQLQTRIAFADSEIATLSAAIDDQAVDAYMNALTFPGMALVGSDTMEGMMVAGAMAGDLINSGAREVGELTVKKQALLDLQASFLAKQEEVTSLKDEVDEEMARLEELFSQADADVAVAIREANAADAEYRAALSAVEAAKAREAESKRQEERPSDPPTSSTTNTTAVPPMTTAPTSPPTTEGEEPWTGRPEVERWRDLVAAYFPADRVDEALQIMQCESLGDPDAYNPYSGASGLFQFLPSTWATVAPKAGFPDASPFDPEANVGAAAWLANRYEELGQYYWQPWSCRRVL